MFNDAYSGLITGGLGLPGCCGLITMRFHLFTCVLVPPKRGGTGGGSRPLLPGEIWSFFKPVTGGDKCLIPWPKVVGKTKHVKVSVKIKDKTFTSEHLIEHPNCDIVLAAITVQHHKKHVSADLIPLSIKAWKHPVQVTAVKTAPLKVIAINRNNDK